MTEGGRMTAAETIAAAIEKIEGLRRRYSGALESIEEDPEVLVSGPWWFGDMASVEAADVVVTLHRTIDAQLAILRETLETVTQYPDDAEQIYPWEIDLARAILGEAS